MSVRGVFPVRTRRVLKSKHLSVAPVTPLMYWLASSGWKKELLYEWSTLFPMCKSIVLLEVLHVSTQAVSRTLTFYHKGTFHSRGSSLHKSSTTSGGSRNSSNLSVAVRGSTWVQPSIMHSKSDQSLESTRRAAINQRLSWIRGYAAPLSAPNVRLKKQFGPKKTFLCVCNLSHCFLCNLFVIRK